MPFGYLDKIMGGGKTQFLSLYGRYWGFRHPEQPIYANYRLNLPNVRFTPYLFLSLKEISKSKACLILIDDFHAYKNMEQFGVVIANTSRKLSMEILVTVQDFKMVPAMIRRLASFKINPSYSKVSDTLFLRYKLKNKNIFMPTIIFKKPVKDVIIPEKLYNTNEIVGVPTERRVIPEILKYSQNINDLDDNLYLYTGNKQERARLFKKVCKIKGWNDTSYEVENIEEQNKYSRLAILKAYTDITYNDLSIATGISETTIFRNIRKEVSSCKKWLEEVES